MVAAVAEKQQSVVAATTEDVKKESMVAAATAKQQSMATATGDVKKQSMVAAAAKRQQSMVATGTKDAKNINSLRALDLSFPPSSSGIFNTQN